MAKNPLIPNRPTVIKTVDFPKSAGILDDYAVRKDIQTKSITIAGAKPILTDGTSTTTAEIPFAEGLNVAVGKQIKLRVDGGAYISADSNSKITISSSSPDADGIKIGATTTADDDGSLTMGRSNVLNFKSADVTIANGYISHNGTISGDTFLSLNAGADGRIECMQDVFIGDSIDIHFGNGGVAGRDFEMYYTGGVLQLNRLSGTGVSATAFVINETSYDLDFRVEGNGDANLLFTDGGNDRVGVGMNNPAYKLDVTGDINCSGVYRAGGTAGISATITTAKLTAGGANGSMTFVGGILTAQTQAT